MKDEQRRETCFREQTLRKESRMSDERAFGALTLLVAVCEQAVAELDGVQPRQDLLVRQIQNTHTAAIEAAKQLAHAEPREQLL